MFFAGRVMNVSNPRPRERDMSSSIVKQIAGLQRQSVPELKQRWRDLFGTEAPAYNRAFLIKRLAVVFQNSSGYEFGRFTGRPALRYG